MTRRVFDGEIAREIAGDDEARYERLRAVARNLLEIVRDGLLRDGEVRIHGFGTFRLQYTAPRTGRNPRTGEPVEIPARNRVLFRPAKALRDRIEPHRAAAVLAEPQPSREASLGGAVSQRAIWPVPASSPSSRPTSPASTEPSVPGRDGARPSREASLGGDVPNVRRAEATVPAAPPRADRQPIYAHATSTAPTAGSGASREATLAAGGGHERSAGVLPGEETEDWVVEGETDVPGHRMARVAAGDGALNEPDPGADDSGGQPGGARPDCDDEARERRRGGFWAAIALALLLLGAALWLLWPGAEPGPRIADQQGAPAAGEETGAEEGATSGDEAAAAGGETGQTDTDTAVATGGAGTDEPADAEGTAEATGIAETSETAEASASGDTGASARASDADGAAGADAGAEGDGVAAGGDEAGGDTTLASGTEAATSGGSASRADGGGDVGQASEQAAADGSQTGQAAGADDGAAGEERPLHGMAAAGSTRAPPADAGSQQASAAEAGNGTMPTSAQDIEDAGAKPANGTGAGEGSANGGVFFEGREYTVQPGDTLWGLAERNYVNPFFWPHIWNNNDDLANPNRISVDQLLWLPTLEGEPTNLTDADRRSIAQGYLQLYRFFQETGDANPGYALVGVRFFDPSVLPERLRGSAAVKPTTAMAATFKARLESRFEPR